MEQYLEKIITDKNNSVKGTVYHYTTTQALFNGILTSRDICLWATNVQYLNDPTELKTGLKFINPYLKNLFPQDVLYNIFRLTLDNAFITSFSMKNDGDYLPMWSMYGANGSGVSLGFDSSTIKNTLKMLI